MGLGRALQACKTPGTVMNHDTRLHAVEHFYDFHPISAQQILAAVAARLQAVVEMTQKEKSFGGPLHRRDLLSA